MLSDETAVSICESAGAQKCSKQIGCECERPFALTHCAMERPKMTTCFVSMAATH